MSTNEIANKIIEIKELKTLAEQIAEEISALENAVKAEMITQGTEEMTVDIYKVRFTKIKTNRFDTTSFKKFHADLYEQFLKPSESCRFTIA